MINLRIARSIEEGRLLLLSGRELDQLAVPPSLDLRIQKTFGEALTPLEVVERIVSAVKAEGDKALEYYCKLIDGAYHQPLKVDSDEIASARQRIPADLLDALQLAADRILTFHRKAARQSWIETTPEGVFGQIIRPLNRVGLYVPGGTAAYPSSLLMSALPAKAAGVAEIIVCTPPAKDGRIPATVLAAAQIAGVSAIYKLGGAQAIAAMAYGTQSVPRVDKILGPGNLFVALAKRMVSGAVGIDALSGPTETLVIADDVARVEHVVADLLAQAEHDALAQPILITTSPSLLEQLPEEIERQLRDLQRAQIARESMEKMCGVVLVADLAETVQLANNTPPEHLCLEVADRGRFGLGAGGRWDLRRIPFGRGAGGLHRRTLRDAHRQERSFLFTFER